MIELITGAIGSGKTLKAVELIPEREKNYDLIYTNIDGLIPEYFWMDNNDKLKVIIDDFNQQTLIDLFYKHKDDKYKVLFIIDEIGFYFLNDKKQLEKNFLNFMAYSRHYNLDFIFICQEPAQLHYQLRHLVNEHTHIRRKFGTGLLTILKKQGIIYETQNPFVLKSQVQSGDIISTRGYIKKKYFEAYLSSRTAAHNAAPPIPIGIKIKLFLFTLPLVGFYLWISHHYLNNKSEVIIDEQQQQQQQTPKYKQEDINKDREKNIKRGSGGDAGSKAEPHVTQEEEIINYYSQFINQVEKP